MRLVRLEPELVIDCICSPESGLRAMSLFWWRRVLPEDS